MKNLVGRLLDQSSNSLRRVASFWDIRISQSATHEDVFYLCREMLDERSGRRLLEILGPDETAVLRYLLSRHNFWSYTTDIAAATGLGEDTLALVFSKFQEVALAFMEDVTIKGNRMIFGQPATINPFDSPGGRRRMLSIPRELGRLLLNLVQQMDEPPRTDEANASLLGRFDVSQLERIARNWGIPAPAEASSKEELVAALAQTTCDQVEIARIIKSLERGGLAIYRAVRRTGGQMLLKDLRNQCHADEDTIRRLLRSLADRFIVVETYRGAERVLFIPRQILDPKNQYKAPPARLLTAMAPAKVTAAVPFALPQDLLSFLSFVAQSDASITATTHQLPKRLSKRLAGALAIEDEDKIVPYLQLLQHVSTKLGLLARSGRDLFVTTAIDRWVAMDFSGQMRQIYKLWLADRWWHEPAGIEEVWGGNWTNARLKVVDWLRTCQSTKWYSIDSLVQATRNNDPYFMRSKQEIVRFHGYRGLERIKEEWEEYEGKALRGIVRTVAYWLGMVELGHENGTQPDSFRVTELSEYLLSDRWDAEQSHQEQASLIVQPNFEIVVFNPMPGVVWSLLQFTDALRRDRVNVYALTKESVQRGLDRGLRVQEMLDILTKHSQKGIPQNITYTLQDWGRQFKEVSLHRALLIETEDSVILEELLASKVLAEYSVRRLSRTAASVTLPEGECKSREDELAALIRDLKKTGYVIRNSHK